MARVPPTPIPQHPDLPQRSDRATFAAKADAFVDWQANELAPGIETLAEQTYQNAVDAHESASTVDDAAATAVSAAASATADAVKTAADRQAVEDALIDGPVLSVNEQAGAVDIFSGPISAAKADLSNVDQEVARTKVGTGTMAYRNVTISTDDPSGGADGDVWFKV